MPKGTTVRIRQRSSPLVAGDWSTKGVIVEKQESPRSYIVKTQEGKTLRRNRRDLMPTQEYFTEVTRDLGDQSASGEGPQTEEETTLGDETIAEEVENPQTTIVTTRYGRVVNLP